MYVRNNNNLSEEDKIELIKILNVDPYINTLSILDVKYDINNKGLDITGVFEKSDLNFSTIAGYAGIKEVYYNYFMQDFETAFKTIPLLQKYFDKENNKNTRFIKRFL